MEVREADLIVHVVDASHPRHEEQMHVVEEVLGEILTHEVPRLVVLNKSDLLDDDVAGCGLRLRYPEAEMISALSTSSLDRLRERLAHELSTIQTRVRLSFPTTRLGEAQEIVRRGRVLSEMYVDGTCYGEYALTRPDIDRLRHAGFKVRYVRA